MVGFDLDTMRRHSLWLVFTASFFIMAGAVSLTLLVPVKSTALQENLDRTFSLWGTYQSPERCRECHAPEFAAWSNTTHAQASFDPIFQVYLQQVEQPGECFACHTTGYNTNTGQFVLAGVTCEACHGPYRPQHPEESMLIATSADMCGSCHPSTLGEWQSSRHGQVSVTCIDCHEVHTQKTHAAVATNALCTGCHQPQTQDETHTTHIEADIHCVDCHLARPTDDGRGAVNGHAMTGHSFTVFVKTCKDCHDEPVSYITP
ncbi:MAG: multiheme c-type cytochrome [Chloroflexota bacterium]